MAKKTIAIIAHDGKKADMVSFVRDHIDIIEQYNIVATGTTGGHIENAGLHVQKKLSGPMGGDAQIAADIVEGSIDALIFLRDPWGSIRTILISICSCVFAMCTISLSRPTWQRPN